MAADWEVVAIGDATMAGPAAQSGPSPASFLQRAAASFKSSPQSEANFYATRFGAENVRLSRDNEVEIKDPKSGQWRRADPSGFDIGDIADVAGAVPEMVGGALGAIGAGLLAAPSGPGAIPAAMAGGAGGTAAGNILKQAVGAMIPGEDVETLGQRAGEVALAGAFGGVGEGAGQLAYHGVIRPGARYVLGRAMQSGAGGAVPEARAIEAAVNRGAPPGAAPFAFTPGEATGAKSLQMIEEAARKDVAGSQLFAERTAQDMAALRDKAWRLIAEVRGGKRPMSDLAAGAGMRSLFDEVDNTMLDLLQAQATKDFAVLDTPVARRLPIQTPNFMDTLTRLASEDINSAGVPGAIAEGVAKLTKELPDQLTAKDINLYLKRLGRMGYGKGDKSFMEKLGDTDRAKMARQLFAALSKDVDEAAHSTQPGRTIAKQLMAAKDRFKAGLTEIDGWQNSLFAKVVGDYGPESAGRIVDNLYKLQPPELKAVLHILDYRPQVANAVRANWIERAFNKSQEKMMTRAGVGPWFDADSFVKALGDSKQIEALFGRTHREVLNDIIMLRRAVARMSSREFTDAGTSIAGQSKLMRLMGAAPHPSRWAETIKQILVPRKMTKLLLDPKTRDEIAIVANAKAPSQRVVAAITYLLGQEAADIPQQ